MAGSSFGYEDEGHSISDINVTPLVDVMLVLLIIFMVTAPVIAARGIGVDSPQTVAGGPISASLTLTLTASGELYVNDTFYPAAQRGRALSELRTLAAADPEATAFIAGDRRAPHGDVMEIIDLVKASGIETFALRSVPKVLDKPEPDL